jgi:hypothetical protein
MKNLRTSLLCLCIMLTYLSGFAQTQHDAVPINEPDKNRPKMFQNLPDFIPVDLDNINVLLNTASGRNISTNLSVDLPVQFDGQIVSTSDKNDNTVLSVVIRSSNYPGARLTLSKINLPDGTIKYTGRLMSFQHADLYELQNREGRLFLVKRNFYDLVNE